jgi:hypothetical protein
MREIMIAAVRDLKEQLLAQRQRCAKCSMNICDLEVPTCRGRYRMENFSKSG